MIPQLTRSRTRGRAPSSPHSTPRPRTSDVVRAGSDGAGGALAPAPGAVAYPPYPYGGDAEIAWSNAQHTFSRKARVSTEQVARAVIAERRAAAIQEQINALGINDFLGATTLDLVEPVPPQPMMLNLLAPTGHTLIWGDGDLGKGRLTAWIITRLVNDLGKRVLIADYEDHIDEWAFRLYTLGCNLSQVMWIAPNGEHSHAPPGAIWDHENFIRQQAAEFEADWLVVDSVSFACVGAELTKETTPPQYGSAIQKIGLPTLSFAHVTKVDARGKADKPLGSTLWYAQIRVGWSLERKEGNLRLTCRKSNAYEKPPRQRVEFHYDDDTGKRLLDVTLTPEQARLADDIFEILDRPMSVREIVAALNAELDEDDHVEANSARHALNRGLRETRRNPRQFTLDGETWSRYDARDTLVHSLTNGTGDTGEEAS